MCQLEDEAEIPGLRRGRHMTLRQLAELYLRDFEMTRGHRRSERTLRSYRHLWDFHLLPQAGHLRLCEIGPEYVGELQRQIAAKARERGGRARSGGRYAANRALQQLNAAFRFALAKEWVLRNPASCAAVVRFEELSADEFLDEEAYAAIGRVIRELEAEQAASPFRKAKPRLRALAALRLAIYTGARHCEELLWAETSWCPTWRARCRASASPEPRATGAIAGGAGSTSARTAPGSSARWSGPPDRNTC